MTFVENKALVLSSPVKCRELGSPVEVGYTWYWFGTIVVTGAAIPASIVKTLLWRHHTSFNFNLQSEKLCSCFSTTLS